MLHASTQKLILKLCDLTERAEAPWKECGPEVSCFETEGYRIEVKAEPPHLRILGHGGKEVESADAAVLANAPAPNEPGKTFADKVRRLAMDAQRIARGAETAISTIMNALSAPPREPPAHFSTAGGPESEAAMAAAVADMAVRLSQPAPSVSAPSSTPRNVRLLAEAFPARNVKTAAMFGAIPSFVMSKAPATANTKVTSSGLMVTGFRATSVQTPEVHRQHPPVERAKPSSAGYRPWT
jgi:hypothetical protein